MLPVGKKILIVGTLVAIFVLISSMMWMLYDQQLLSLKYFNLSDHKESSLHVFECLFDHFALSNITEICSTFGTNSPKMAIQTYKGPNLPLFSNIKPYYN